jgi:alcohol dehydrogenase
MDSIRNFTFRSPTALALGNGVADEAGERLGKLGVSKALLVTDAIIEKVGIASRVRASLEASGIGSVVFSDVQPEPPVENAYAALDLFKSGGCDGIVGLGGGSALDVAKAAAMLATNPGVFEKYAGIGKVPRKCAPLVLMPTTSGTGSEVSIFSIMIVGGSKMGVVDQNITADLALVDPLLTLSVPRPVTAATGLDAFCHHLESFLSVNHSPICDMICLEGLRMIGLHLRQAVGNPDDREARYWMSYASTLGGYVMNLTEGAAANHGLAFAVGALFHVGHGLSNAIMLPHVLPVIGLAELRKVRRVGVALGLDLEGLPDREALDEVVGAIDRLVTDVGCKVSLASIGVKENDVAVLTAETVRTQGRVMGHSTWRLTPNEISAIFLKAL